MKKKVKLNVQLLVIDPENDFCWPGIDLDELSIEEKNTLIQYVPPDVINPGALFVPGADKDMDRLSVFIKTYRQLLDDIHATMDEHHFVDIAHPVFWVNSKGEHPGDYDFTIITAKDVKNGVWMTTNQHFQKRALEYVTKLEINGRYPLCAWPPHCRIGTWGSAVYPPLAEEFLNWEKDFAIVNYVTKGSNYWTEHYSAVQADVPDEEDMTTQLNLEDNGLIKTTEKADIVLLAGEARGHCLANTVRDIADNFDEDSIKKLHLLEDCTSDVEGFEHFGEAFINEMVPRGMQLTNTKEFTEDKFYAFKEV
jgi:nicotinamidase-related amidase